MNVPNTRVGFATTDWSLVLRAQLDPEELGRLLSRYWSPVYAFIRRSGHDPAAAADLTQEFISQVVLGRDLVQKSDPSRGRFRTLLQTAVRNFLIDQHRREHARGRAPGTVVVPLSSALLAEIEPAAEDSPADAFDRQWATRMIADTVEQLRADCQQSGLSRQWAAFEAVVLQPAIVGTAPPSLAEVAAELGKSEAAELYQPEQVSNMLQTMKRRFKRKLRETVARTLSDVMELDEELAALRRFLGV